MATKGTLAIVGFLCVACGSSPTPAAASSPSATPTADAVQQAYVAIVKSYWEAHLAADGVSGRTNVASRACLGTINNNAAPDETLVDTATCHERGVLILASQEKFLTDLEGIVAPEQFAGDDKIFRRDLPATIVALKAMNSAAADGNKQATFDAAQRYVAIMIPSVVGALDDVDPTTRHY